MNGTKKKRGVKPPGLTLPRETAQTMREKTPRPKKAATHIPTSKPKTSVPKIGKTRKKKEL